MLNTVITVPKELDKKSTPLYNLEYWLDGRKVTTIRRHIPKVEATSIIISINKIGKYYKTGLLIPRRVTGLTRMHTYAYKSLALFDKAFSQQGKKSLLD